MLPSVVEPRQVLDELEGLSPALLKQVLAFVRFLKFQSQVMPAETVPRGHYDFSDLVGKLVWQGDAVATQKRLRDEW